MAQLMQVKLSRFDAQPWGFRLQGGTDFGTPLVVQKVNGGSLSEQAGLLPGDAVIKINDVDVYTLRHKDAQDLVVRSGNNFVITIQRGGSTWRPHVTPTGQVPNPQGGHMGNHIPTVTKTSLALKKPQEEEHIGCGYNNAARPFNSVNGNSGPVKSIVNKQYNTPVGIYSDESIAETLSAQAELLAEGVLGVNFKKNEKQYNAEKSEVLKFLREAEHDTEPEPHSPANFYWTQSHAIGGNQSPGPRVPRNIQSEDVRMGTSLQQNTLAPSASHRPSMPVHNMQQEQQIQQQQHTSEPELIIDPSEILEPICPSLQGHHQQAEQVGPAPTSALPMCISCGAGIAGVFVRIKDKNLHVECFKCATCGTSLKNQGYYNFNNKLYCDIHAKLAAIQNPPPGTDGNTKLSANTISAALSSHGYQGIPPSANTNGNGVYQAQHKVNQPFTRPYGASPMSPPQAGPKSPSSYPPPSHAQAPAPAWAQPKPAPAAQSPYATLPRSNAGPQQQEETTLYTEQVYEQAQVQQSQSYFEEDLELSEVNRDTRSSFNWPPKEDTGHSAPTAAPLYIPPPETQHVIAKPLQVKFEEQQQWQSRSAPELTSHQPEIESGAESYTSTCTTTTATSDEYQRMYAAQVQYQQSESDVDYHVDMEVASVHQQAESSYLSATEYSSCTSGRRSAQECVEQLSAPLSTYQLVGMVRDVTPAPAPIPSKGPKKVEFADETKQSDYREPETQRLFQPTPEITYVIPEGRRILPSNIPNPSPKEWISPMVQALTTAPDTPIQLPECICHSPCLDFCQAKCTESEPIQKDPPQHEPEILKESPPKASLITDIMSIAPTDPFKFAPKADEPITLPDETEPYLPPPMNMQPYLREDFRPKSPFLSALITAPEEPLKPFERDVPIHVLDLPTPSEKLSMVDALRIAPDTCYTSLNPENSANYVGTLTTGENIQSSYKFIEETKHTVEDERSAFANMTTNQTEKPFQPAVGPLTPRQSLCDTSECRRYSCNQTQNNSCGMASYNTSTSMANQTDPCQSESKTTSAPKSHSQIDKVSSSQSQYTSAVDCRKSSCPYLAQNKPQSVADPCQSENRTFAPPSYSVQSQLNTNQETKISSSQSQYTSDIECEKSSYSYQTQTSSQTQRQLQKQLTAELEFDPKISFPPPSPLGPNAKRAVLSGLHRPETIPQYQRNWTVLPTQRPVRTPEPQELRENVPLAFLDASPSPTPTPIQQQKLPKPQQTKTVPIIIEDRSGPVTMTFQSLDEHLIKEDQPNSRPYTPSMINKAAPIIPFYQAPEKLLFEECDAAKAQLFDRMSVSPYPDRARSPAPGPPPNPLSAIRAPRIKEDNLSVIPRTPQAGSITTGQSYLGAAQAQGQILSQYQTSSQSGYQSYADKPEIVQQKTVGDMSIERREKESRMEEAKRAQVESNTRTQIGNTQIERRRKVVEEYEHTQSAKTVEIRTESAGQYGKTGYVANQARRLSGLDQELTDLSTQSRAISAKAADLTKFPEISSPEPMAKFPTKPVFPPHDEPKSATYVISATSANKMVGPPPGFKSQQKLPTSSYDPSSFSQQQKQQQPLSSLATNALTNSKACATNQKASALPIPAYKPPTFTSASNTGGNVSGSSSCNSGQPSCNNNTYRPTASTGPSGFKPPKQQQPPPSAITDTNLNLNINIDNNSAGGSGLNKGGAFGATSAPKRGRGVWNNAVANGIRTPQCGSCGIQIRGPFITALGRIWCPEHFICVNGNCRRPLQDIGFVEEKGDLYCEYCFEQFLAPTCSKCNGKIKGDCLNAIGKHFHPECFNCFYCGKLFGNTPFFLEEGNPYCEADWNELFTTKCFACGFPVEAGDRWVEALSHNYHSQCFNCTMCKKNLEGQSFYNKGGRPFCKNHAR